MKRFKTETNRYFFESLINFWRPYISNEKIPLWIEYTLSVNDRGREIASIVEKYTQIKDATYLDTGFSYGGSIVAFSEKGAASYGFEINRDIYNIAVENFKDNNINPEIYIQDIEGNIDEKFKNFFNIITCNNVLEHVNNPEKVIMNIASMLCYRGTAYFEIPNKYYPSSVLKDEHTSLFDITLLERDSALSYYKKIHREGIYTVGYYLTLDEYMNLFQKAGLTASVIKETFTDYKNDKILKDIEEIKNNKYSVPYDIEKLLREKVRYYLKNFFHTLKYDEEKFIVHYGVPYWKIICRKDSL